MRRLVALAGALLLASSCSTVGGGEGQPDPLPSWNSGPVKERILSFVASVTDPDSASFVREEERIAVFDNDGTLWSEQPMYVQLAFALDRVKALAPEHPEWKTTQPFQAVLEGDHETLGKAGEEGLIQLVMATHAGMTTDEFEEIAVEWLDAARHPVYERPYVELVYQPMIELLEHLHATGFRVFIVSGGGTAFMRPWTERVYGIPPERVIGSRIGTAFEIRDGVPVIVRKPELAFIDDKAGKPVGIHEHIGRRPLLAFGNSDGDLQMLQWTAAGEKERLMLLLHHTDAVRETAYDRESHIGRLDAALEEAEARDWVVVEMARDWSAVFAE
jgi:phosphoserine phosphatase